MTPEIIIVHCSNSDVKSHDNPKTIDDWHKARGFKRRVPRDGFPVGDLEHIGYQYVITTDGKTHKGRRPDEVGAHCKGYNDRSIGICLTGKGGFTVAQIMSLKKLVFCLTNVFDIPSDAVYPHSRFNKGKTCPNFKLPTRWDRWIV